MDELQAGIQLPLAVLPQPSALFNHAKLRSTIHRLGITLNVCNSLLLAICTVTYPPRISRTPLREGLAHVATVAQQALHPLEPTLAARWRTGLLCDQSPPL